MKTTLMQRRRFLGSLMAVPMAAWLGAPAVANAGPFVEVWKDPACCCKDWIALLRKAGFTVTARESGNVAARAKARIAARYGSCHTALVEGFAIEGHVPVREIQRLLKEWVLSGRPRNPRLRSRSRVRLPKLQATRMQQSRVRCARY